MPESTLTCKPSAEPALTSSAPPQGMDITATVKRIFAEGGEVALQAALQSEIQRVKRKEAELATLRNKVKNTRKENEALLDKSRKLTSKSAALSQQCRLLQAEAENRDTREKKAAVDMENHRREISKRVATSVRDVREKHEAKEAEIAALDKQAEELQSEVDALKAAFEKDYEAYSDNCKSSETLSNELVGKLRAIISTNEVKQNQLAMLERELVLLNEGSQLFSSKLSMYEGRVGGMDATTLKADEVETVAKNQLLGLEERYKAINEDKKTANAARIQFEKELAEQRTRLAVARRQLVEVERAKTAIEKKCRQAQEAMKNKRK